MPSDTEEFLADYRQYVEQTVKPVQKAVQQALNKWREEDYWAHFAGATEASPTPISQRRTRIKRPESVRDKYVRLPDQFPNGGHPDSLRSLRDLLGARIVTYFQSHISLIDAEIRSNRHFVIAPGFKPRSYMPAPVMKRIGLEVDQFESRGRKPNGYSSLHYFLHLADCEEADTSFIFELQVRTMSDDLWSSIEHILAYKTDRMTEFSVTRQFRVISEHLSAIDTHLDFLYDQLVYHQENADPKLDDLLNAENFPSVLRKIGFVASQSQVAKMLEILSLSNVETVRQFQIIANSAVVDQLNAEYKRQAGPALRTFTLVSLLAMIAENGYSPRDAVARAIAMNEYTHGVLRKREP